MTLTSLWGRMLKVMGYDELSEDPEYAAPMFATDKAEIRMELLHIWCEEHTVEQVVEALVAADIPVGEARSIPEVLEDKHIWEREVMMEMEIDEPKGKKMLVPGPNAGLLRALARVHRASGKAPPSVVGAAG